METITYDQVQQVVIQLPSRKLPLAYRLLKNLVKGETDALAPQQAFLRLPLAERRRIMTQQAEQLRDHYQHTEIERSEWVDQNFSRGYLAITGA